MDVKEVKTVCIMLDKEEAKKIDECLAYCNVQLSTESFNCTLKLSHATVSYFRNKFQEIIELL